MKYQILNTLRGENNNMLSKKEKEYLQGNLKLSKNYEHKLIHSIKKKLKTLYEVDFPLLSRRRNNSGLGKMTSYQTKLTPPRRHSLIMIKYLDCKIIPWMQNAQNVRELQF